MKKNHERHIGSARPIVAAFKAVGSILLILLSCFAVPSSSAVAATLATVHYDVDGFGGGYGALDQGCSSSGLSALTLEDVRDMYSACIAETYSDTLYDYTRNGYRSNCLNANTCYNWYSAVRKSDGLFIENYAYTMGVVRTIYECWDGSQPVNMDGVRLCLDSPPTAEKNRGTPENCPVSNPVDPGNGNKYHIETDVSDERIPFTRTYNSTSVSANIILPAVGFGARWSHRYGSFVQSISATEVAVFRPDGKIYRFAESGGVWSPDADVEDRLEAITGGWEYTTTDSTTETYDAAGVLQSITDIRGNTQTLTYNATSDLLERVDSNAGEFLLFGYDAQNRISSITDRANRVWGYRYDANGNLQYVDNPDGTTKQYHYEDPSFPHALTGIADERGVRYATYGYDAEGRAILSTHANNAQRVDILYNADGTRTVTNSLGQPSTHSTATQLGVALVTDISGPGCSTCGGSNTSYQYDPANNNLLSKTENGVTTQYGDYDAKGQSGYKIEAVGTSEERRTDYTYDARFFNRITSITEPSVNPAGSKVTSYTYDDFGNRTTETVSGFAPDGQGGFVPVSRTTTWQYNGPLNQLSFMDGPRTDVNDVTTYRYYADDPLEGNNRARLKEIEDANGVLSRANIQYSATGKVLSKSRPNGLTLGYTYYLGNDRLETLTESDGTSSRVTQWTYLATGEVETITTGFGTPEATALTFGYDDARRLTRITDGLGNYIQYTLDTEGNRKEEKTHDSAGLLRKQLSQTFDLYNRLDVSSQANERADYDFAPDGTLDKTTDGQGSVTTVTDYSYDALKRLTQVTQDLGGTDPTTGNATTVYGYDAQDRLSSVTDPINGNTTYVYDDLGNLVSQTSPDTGTTHFVYDSAGNLTQKTDAKGQVFAYSYDALNRLTGLDAPGTADDIGYTYDSCTNGVGRQCSVTQAGAVADYVYNAFGDISAHQGVSYAYDVAGRVQSLTYPSGAILSYVYDAAGQVDRVELTAGGTTTVLASSIQYQPFGPVSNLTYGNGLVLNQSLDTAYRLTDITAGSALSLTGAQYDELGNMTGRTDDGTTTIWGYDALSRLDVANGLFGSRDYDYDKNGNRSQLITDGQTIGYSYELGSNRLASETGWMYTRDANGNTTEQLAADGTGRLYAYTSHNRLATVTDRTITLQGKGKNKTEVITDTELASYAYNGLSQRVSKTIDGTARHYVYGTGGELLAELDETGGPLRDYLYLNGHPLALLANTVNPGGDGAEIVMDNGDAGTGGTGSWTLKSSNKDYGTNYLLANGGTGSTYRWTPTLAPGTYAVYAWWVSHNSHSDNVSYTLVHNGVTEQIVQDQSRNGGRWVLLGSYEFAGDGTDYIEVSDANGKTSADAVRFVEQLPPQVQTEVYYIHNDHLGAPQAMTDATGTTVWQADYDPFGQAAVNEDVDGNGTPVTLNVRFPGQYYDRETGLHYNYFRYYDPATGRYLTSDPIGLDGGLNTYLYVLANPVRYTDPTGLAVPVPIAPGGALGGFGGIGGIGSGSSSSGISNGDVIDFPGGRGRGRDTGRDSSRDQPKQCSPNSGGKCKFTGKATFTQTGPNQYKLNCWYKCPRKGLRKRSTTLFFPSENPAFLCEPEMDEIFL